MRQSGELKSVSAISYNFGESSKTQIEERLGVEALAEVMMNFDNDCIEEYESLVTDLDRGDVRFKPKKYELDMKNGESTRKTIYRGGSKVRTKSSPTSSQV